MMTSRTYSRKTVREGALFYQECLPPETLFYSLVFANDSRHQGHKKRASEIMDYLRSNLAPVLQVGGDETTGKGLCAVRLSNTNGGTQ
jgi:CRISPR-associated protein Cmr4